MVDVPSSAGARRGRGRPREFDMDAVLDAAVLVFRERGYHGASLDDLLAATELTNGSIYKAFGDKRAVFLAAFDHYSKRGIARLRERLDQQPSGLEKLRTMLQHYANSAYGLEGRRGCLVVGSATVLATLDPDMGQRVKAALRRMEALLLELIILGQKDGSVAAGIDAKDSAQTLFCVLQGLRVAGKTGRTRRDAQAVVSQAIRLIK